MQRTLSSIFIVCLSLCSTSHAAKEILLRLQPVADAPVIAKVTASEKVLLDAAPAPENAALGWRTLALPTPFEGYVPTPTLEKSLTIQAGTAVHYLPTTNSAIITQIEADDTYEVIRVKDDWATVRIKKDIVGYFSDAGSEEARIDFKPLQAPLVTIEPTPEISPTPEPVMIPAPRTRLNPDEPIGQLDPKALPAENVVWQPARTELVEGARLRVSESEGDRLGRISNPKSRISDPAIMVTPAQTQAREISPELGPAKTPRLLTGQLVREIQVSGPGYPIRLKSTEGRLIAYVDFSKIYINDLSPYLGQKVYLRGQIHPLPNNQSQLVIIAESLRLAE